MCYNKGRQKPPLTIVEKAARRFFEENSLRFVPCHPQGGCDIAPSRHYDSRALSGAPIVLFPSQTALHRFPLRAKCFLPEGELPRSGQEKPLWRAHVSRQKTDLN